MPAKYLTIGDVATLVRHRGSTTLPGAAPDTANGHPVVLLHDAGGNGNCFADLMDALADAQSPIAFDMPGHGRSGGLDSLGSVDAMVGHTVAMIEAFSLSNVVLVGEGLGSAVAVETAKAAPSSVAGVVHIGGVGTSYDVAADIESLAAITSGRARREFDRSGYGPDTDRSVYQKAFGEWVKTDPRATLGDRRGQAEWSLSGAPASPSLVVTGEHTEDEHAASATALAEALGAQTGTLAGAGRRGAIEQPEALAGMINDFIGGLS